MAAGLYPEETWDKIKATYRTTFKDLVMGILPAEENLIADLKIIHTRLLQVNWVMNLKLLNLSSNILRTVSAKFGEDTVSPAGVLTVCWAQASQASVANNEAVWYYCDYIRKATLIRIVIFFISFLFKCVIGIIT